MPVVEVAPMPVVYGPPAPVSFVDAEGPAVEQPEAPAPRIETDDRSLIEKIGPTKFAIHSVAAGLDAYSTYRCSHLRTGPTGGRYSTCVEGNPVTRKIFGKHMSKGEAVAAFGLWEAIYIGGSWAMGEATGYDSTATQTVQVSLIGAHGVAATLNFRFRKN